MAAASWAVKLQGRFEPYDELVSRRIEAAYAAQEMEARKVIVRSQAYTIDFSTMRQILESDRSKQRQVERRLTSGGAGAPAPAAAGAYPSPSSATAAPLPPASAAAPASVAAPAPTAAKRRLPDVLAAGAGIGTPRTEPKAVEASKVAKTETSPAAPTSGGAGPLHVAAAADGAAADSAKGSSSRVPKPKADEYVGADIDLVRLNPASIRDALSHLAQFDELSELALAASASPETLYTRESPLQAFERMCEFRLRQGKSPAEGDVVVCDVKRRAGGVWSPEAVLSREASMRGHTSCAARLQRIGTCIDLARLFAADPPPDFEAMCDAEVLQSPMHGIHGIGEHTMRKVSACMIHPQRPPSRGLPLHFPARPSPLTHSSSCPR